MQIIYMYANASRIIVSLIRYGLCDCPQLALMQQMHIHKYLYKDGNASAIRRIFRNILKYY